MENNNNSNNTKNIVKKILKVVLFPFRVILRIMSFVLIKGIRDGLRK